MGLFDNLFGGGDKRREKTIEKASKKLKNPHHQTQERKRMIEVLTEIGTSEAVFALLGRFSMRTPGSIVDEDEKQMVYQSLLQLGPVAVEPIQRFIATQDAVYWPLRALTEIAGDDVAIDTLLVALGQAEHGYNADMDRREQLVANLREFLDSKRVADRLVELADDPHEEVRVLALDSLCETDDARVPDLIVRKVTSEDETHRVKATLFTILVDRRIDMGAHREALSAVLPENLWIDGNGIVQRK
jgi:hypothetical protein